jgi:hypothetical protein
VCHASREKGGKEEITQKLVVSSFLSQQLDFTQKWIISQTAKRKLLSRGFDIFNGKNKKNVEKVAFVLYRRRTMKWRATLVLPPCCERRTGTFPRRWPARAG